MTCNYICNKCHKSYEYYESVTDDKDFDNMVYQEKERYRKEHDVNEIPTSINANCFVLKKHYPVPETVGEQLRLSNPEGNLKDTIINLCPDCMRELLLSIDPYNTSSNCFDIV